MTKNRTIILVAFILLKFIIQYSLTSPEYELQRDEFLHLDQANHLAWGFQSVPPVTSWISVIIKFLGNSVFWIKFFPALFGALTIVVVWKAVEEIGGNLFALILASCCVTFSVLFRLNALFQPNSLDVLSWTIVFFFIIKYLNRNEGKWIYYLCIAFAIGFLNKYNVVFLFMGLLPAIILVPERRILTNKKLYIGILITLLIILPNLIWQYTNNFPVVKHMKELAETQLVNVNRWDFIFNQFVFFPGTILVVFLGIIGLIIYPPFQKYRLFVWSFFFTLAIFLLFKAKHYYAIGLYPIYFAFGSVYIASLLENKWGRVLKPVLVILSVLMFVPIYLVAFPNKSPEYIVNHPEYYRKFGLLLWEDGKEHDIPQDFADMLGWKELARKVDSVYNNIPKSENTLVFCDNYGQAGAINYYSKHGIQAVSFNADYINWIDLDKKYDNLIRITHADDRDQEFEELSPAFENSYIIGSIENKYSREYGSNILLFLATKIDINERLKIEISEEQENNSK